MNHYKPAGGSSYEEKLKQHGFSAKDAAALKNMTSIMTSRVVCEYLVSYVKDIAAKENLEATTDKSNPRFKLYKKILGILQRQRVEQHTGFMTMDFDDVEKQPYRLHMQLSIVDKDHEIELRVPRVADFDKFKRILFSYVDRLVDLATGYYTHVLSTPGLLSDLAEFLENIDVSKFKRNDANRHLYFDEDYRRRIGCLMFYVDDNGKPLVSPDEISADENKKSSEDSTETQKTIETPQVTESQKTIEKQ